MFKKPLLILFLILIVMFLCSPIIVFAQETNQSTEINAPKLQMPIPGVPELSKVKVEGGFISIPWLAQYIAGVYKYAVGLAVSLTIFMLMVGGFLWITAAGDAGKIGKAKTVITDAVIGLILALGSYLILYTINPDIVEFKAIQVGVVKQDLWEVGSSAVELEPGQDYVTPASTTITSSSEDCKEVSRLTKAGEIKFAKENDKKGFLEKDGVIKRLRCVWCYGGKNEAPNGPCTGEGEFITTDPKICKLFLELHKAKKEGKLKESINVRCVICGHTRCARKEGTSACEQCKETATPGGKAKGQSNHWLGSGLDLPPDENLQKYIVENLMGLGISQIIGPFGWENYSNITCTKDVNNPKKLNVTIGTKREGKVRSPYNVNNGKNNATYGADTLCGHLDHIHVGF